METNPALERAIAFDLDDVGARSVYADWLQSRGDPRGELIAMQLAGNSARAGELLARHAETLLGELANHPTTHDGDKRDMLIWKYGFIHTARLSHNSYAEKLEGGLAGLARTLLAHPSARFLAELELVHNGKPNKDNLQSVIDVISEAPRPTLRKLVLGDFRPGGEVLLTTSNRSEAVGYEITWYSVGNCEHLWAAVPNLTMLIIQSESSTSAMRGGTQLGTLRLPALRSLDYRTGGLEAANAEALAAIDAPNLEDLDLSFGAANYGGEATLDTLAKLLARRDLPNLRHLGVTNCGFIDDVIELLATSPLLPRLAELDLSLGFLTEDGAARIVAHRDTFKHLARFDVSRTYLTPEAAASLEGIASVVVDPTFRGESEGDGDVDEE